MQLAQAPVGEWFRCEESEGDEGVEVKFTEDGRVLLRDSRARGAGPVLEFLPQAWDALLRGARSGEFDRPMTPIAIHE
ncbi:hypothetical protein Kisp01_70240 [Kineosporia sp. NBRC 101677]|uniref:DUF397 domain-containing protein n=1 Tax=Kineosporia sp. NBRC 101677 TaxID=3032197 RepID=UPI0024A33E30|nr:DUF397 domain-containing protein [Kineosporia sp. NBRC 101677]GLY20010.1 hypothetical protein Kisp01_70240 [Kineosporia sp. NBRC 101677]